MSYRVALVTEDQTTIGNHFARAESFAIYQVRDDFTYAHQENRPSTGTTTAVESRADGRPDACGCADNAVCETSPGEQSGSANGGESSVGYALAGGSCGSGGGCGSGGCGGGGGCGSGGEEGPADPRLEQVAASLADVQIVIAGTLGPQAQAVLARRGIRAFAVSGSVTKALDKLVAFEKRQHQRHLARPAG